MDMNNMKYCSDSLAHDYDLFTVKPKKQNNVIDMPETVAPSKKVKKAKAVKPNVLTATIVSFLVLTLLLRYLFSVADHRRTREDIW